MTLSDLEWRCETFTDTKHRAFFLPATAELLGEIRASGLSNGKNRMVVCSFCVQMQMNSSSWVASVLAAFSTGNGDWLFELPIASCGLRLHNYTPFMLRSAAVSAHVCNVDVSLANKLTHTQLLAQRQHFRSFFYCNMRHIQLQLPTTSDVYCNNHLQMFIMWVELP